MNHSSSPARFDRIVLIYNPRSSGIPVYLAEHLRADLDRRLPDTPVALQPTESAGHARALARAAAGGRPLIVSVSGDGGYNEVVNGVMETEGSQAVCAVLAGGNANDHRRSTRRLPLIEAIVRGEVRRIDLLRLTVGEGPAAWSHYAHSYIGFGLTPLMAIGIEQGNKGRLKELVSVVRTFTKLAPFEIARADGARATFDSLVLANIADMAKYGRISEAGEPDDGMFEVVTLPHAGTWRVGLMALRAATVGLGAQPSVSRYGFITIDPIPFQIDGEVMQIDADTPVLVECAPRALETLG
jgi:diacylglycerol kinase (ATP)